MREGALDLMRLGTARNGHLLLADRDGVPVGAARLALPVRDNTATAELQLHVLPGHRRQGVGSALLTEAGRLAASADRTQLFTEIDEPEIDGPSTDEPGQAFALHHGFRRGLVETRRDLDLPVNPARAAAAEAAARALAAPYTVRVWQDWVPADLLEDRAALERVMSTDVPWGEIEHEEEDYNGARIRQEERLVHAQGRTYVGAAALDDIGRMVAFSDLGFSLSCPDTAEQWGTFVLRAHRGRRLGITVKLAVLRELQRLSPATRRIITWNAESNAVVAVNEALGFRRNGQRSAWTRTKYKGGPRRA